MEFIFDLETTGFPTFPNKKRGHSYPPPENLESYDTARIVSIAWVLVDSKSKNIVQQNYYVIKPTNFTIPKESTNIHHITTEFAQEFGLDIKTMFEHLKNALKRADTILSYNLEFDFNVLHSELIRHNQTELTEDLKSKRQKCIMLMSQIYMDAPFFPKLSDVHRYVFNAPIRDAHNAMGDVLSCYKVYKEIHPRVSL